MKTLCLIATVMLAGCSTTIKWDCDGDPPVIRASEIDALPARFTVEHAIERFSPGMPDPNTMMMMTYSKVDGGRYVFTWCPTHEVPGAYPPEVGTWSDVLKWRVLAVFDVSNSNELNPEKWVYAYPKEQKGKRFTGWQDAPKSSEIP